MAGSGQASGKADSRNSRTVMPDTGSTRRQSRWRRWLKRFVLVLTIAMIVMAVGLVTVESYTARPSFCGSCHIMEPYYQSWTHDTHGSELTVACVECHYAPGEQYTLRGKFRGLSQVASYFSGRSGSGRRRAYVSDASCLTSECHGDGDYLHKAVWVGEPKTETRPTDSQNVEGVCPSSVKFDHRKHLEVAGRLEETVKTLAQTVARLKTVLGKDETYTALARAVVSVAPSIERDAQIRGLLKETGTAVVEADALAWGRLEHLKTRLEQLNGLTCAACHTYDVSGKKHLLVERQTCFTCHFSHEAFNRETGECLRCHKEPTHQIVVHEAPTSQPSAIMMDHREIVRRDIDCVSCHADVVRGQGQVTVRDCSRCHDQDRYISEFAERTTKQVEEYHRVHVVAQHARCDDCHETIQHELAAPATTTSPEGFLQVVLDNCQHCHPHHHREQVQLLTGTSDDGTAITMPNTMFGSRINCRACHTQSGSDFKGAPLIKAAASACVACHDEQYRSILDQWIHEIANRLKECDETLKNLDQRIAQARSEGHDIPPRVMDLTAQARAHVDFLQLGNGIHNRAYALLLLDISEGNLREASDLLPAP